MMLVIVLILFVILGMNLSNLILIAILEASNFSTLHELRGEI